MQRGPGIFHLTPWKPKTNCAGVPGEEGLAGGGGGVLGQELAEIYLGVGAVVDGDGRSRGGGGAQGAAAAAVAGGGAPAVRGGGERVWELHGGE